MADQDPNDEIDLDLDLVPVMAARFKLSANS